MAKVTLILPDSVLRKIDRAAKSQRQSRSAVIREAVRSQIAKSAKGNSKWRKALAPLKDLERQWIGQWDSTDVIRNYRESRHGRDDRR